MDCVVKILHVRHLENVKHHVAIMKNKQEISVRRVKAFWTLIFLQEKQVMRKNL